LPIELSMPDLLYMVAVAGFGLSGLAAAIRLFEWLIRADPRLIAQTSRWAGIGLAVLSLPLLLALLINEKWTAAMALAAVMLLAFAWHGPRLLQRLVRDRIAADWSRPPTGNFTPAFDAGIDDPEPVRLSVAILEEYLRRTAASRTAPHPRAIGVQRSGRGASACHNGSALRRGSGPMSEAEALDILGLAADASQSEIKEAHQRLRGLVGPEQGGSHYLTIKIDQARSLLLGHMDEAAERDPYRHNVRSLPPGKT
jgi:hypothetical protein